MDTPAFRILDERTVHVGYAFETRVATVLAPDGTTFTRDLVRHRGAVGVVPLHDDGTVTLVRQYRVPVGAEVLEIPAGLCDVEGEDTAATARRELAEEVGLAAAGLEQLSTFLNAAGFTDLATVLYLATGLTEVPCDLQGPEELHRTIERVPLADTPRLVESGAISDAKTVIALTLAHLRTR